jgi:hypothetical protein
MKEPECFINKDGTKVWRIGNKLHRLDGPAIECYEYKAWLVYGKYHRLDGPAVEYANGANSWYMHDKFHRLDGPAIEYADGQKSWYIDGKHYQTQQEHALAAFLWMNEHERT